MGLKECVSAIGIGICVLAAICFVPFMSLVLFPFINGLSPEKRLEKFIDEKCLEGNEIAIRIRREGIIYYEARNRLVRSAIEGNEHAIRALKLDPPPSGQSGGEKK